MLKVKQRYINSRKQKREVQRELDKNSKGLKEIEHYFLLTCKKEGIDNFKEVFDFFNKEYIKECRRIRDFKKSTYTYPDFKWFKEKYSNIDKMLKDILISYGNV